MDYPVFNRGNLDLAPFKQVIELVVADSSCPATLNLHTDFNNLYIDDAEDTYFMLRDYHQQQPSRLVIANISLSHRHQGTGSAIIDAVIKAAVSLNCTQVVIESIITKEMLNLAHKKGFISSPIMPNDSVMWLPQH